MLTLIDATRLESSVERLLERSDWLARVRSFGGPVAVLGAETCFADDTNLLRVSGWPQAVAEARRLGEDRIVLVESEQVFLDEGVVSAGLAAAGTAWDYFTQWEFSRLPIGIGIRAFSLKNDRIANWTDGPEDLIDHINASPGGFGLRYETKAYVGYEDSLLDARVTDAAARLFADGAPGAAGLDGFVALLARVGAEDRERLRFVPTKTGARYDERLMPVPFGFESRECAVFPTYIMFDMSNKCNAFCVHCPQGIPEFRAKIGKGIFLTPERFHRVVDECVGRHIDFVRITADGEPMMHPHLMDLIRYTSSKGVGPIGLTTNGSLLKPKQLEDFVTSGLFMVDFSLDAIRRETYALVRKGLPYDRVMDNVRSVVARRDELGMPLKVMVSFVKQPLNIEEAREFEEYWSGQVDKVLVREMISNVGYNDVDNRDAETPERWPCPHWFRRAVVNYDGRLKACPIDWDNGSAYRSIDDVTVFEAWHSEYYWKHRVEHLNNEFSSDSICGPCSDWQGTPWELGYEKVMKKLSATDRDMVAFEK